MEYAIQVSEQASHITAVVRGHVAHDGIGAFLSEAFGEVMSALGGSGVVGPPFARYDMTDGGWDIEAGFPVASAIEPVGVVEPSRLPDGPAATTIHEGPYSSLGGAYVAIEKWLAANGYQPAGSPWETYLNDPHQDETPRTLVVWPCASASS